MYECTNISPEQVPFMSRKKGAPDPLENQFPVEVEEPPTIDTLDEELELMATETERVGARYAVNPDRVWPLPKSRYTESDAYEGFDEFLLQYANEYVELDRFETATHYVLRLLKKVRN